MSKLEFEGDLIRFDGRIVARITPNIPLGLIREFEDWLVLDHPRRLKEMQDAAAEDADAKHEKRHSPTEVRTAVFEAIEPIFQHNVGLVTRDELKQAFEHVIDELSPSG